MHKITVIIISFSILLQSFNFEVTDMNKISILVDHIATHYESGDNFADFISMHYGSELKTHKNKHKEHRELPFKHNHLETHFQYVYALFSNDIFTSFNEITFKENKFAYNEPSSNSYVNSFFQPPQK